MELGDAIVTRESVRDYEDTPVPEDKLMRILETARIAPSGANEQQWIFIVVKEDSRRKELALASGGQPHVAQAPVIIVGVATEPEVLMPCGVPAYAVNLAIAIGHMTLAAVDEGLGTCWIGAFNQEEAKAILNIPEKCCIVSMLTLGNPKSTGRPKIRKSMDEIIRYETYSE